MLVDCLCYIHESGNCRLRATKDQIARLLNVQKNELNDFEIVWQQLIICPDDPDAVTHLKMWEWFISDCDVYLKRQKAGRKGGKQSASKRQANAKQISSKSEANDEQTLYVSSSVYESKFKEPKKVSRFKPPEIDECIQYFIDNGSSKLEAEKFHCFYESNGWKVGKNKMRQWRSAAKGWIKRNSDVDKSQNKNKPKPTYQQNIDSQTKQILENAFSEVFDNGKTKN